MKITRPDGRQVLMSSPVYVTVYDIVAPEIT